MTAKNILFKLIVIEYCEEIPQYPEFEVRRREIGNYSNLVNAEQEMKKEIETGNVNIFGFLIEQYAVENETFSTSVMKNYLSDGTPWDETIVYYDINNFDELYETIGRDAEKIRFNMGDIIEVLNNDIVTLEVVNSTPPTHGELKIGARFPIHYTDNCYRTIDKNYDDNTNKTGDRLFPLRFHVSDMLRKKLMETYLVGMEFHQN
ncbi:MAG: hypothetical protein FWH18_12050 [Marinilabiliaceae bacterium]|nr:hypothetical protein [Marinilabiliaceae bacterium]